jgi:CspA family cold shock protein
MKDKPLKKLKFTHLALGIITLLLAITELANSAFSPAIAPTTSRQLVTTPVGLLLVTSLANLLLSSYFSWRKSAAKRTIQAISTLLVILATLLACYNLLKGELMLNLAVLSNDLVYLLLTLGVLGHLCTNLTGFLKPHRYQHNDSVNKMMSNRGNQSANRESGTVKWFNITKGFGFITRDRGDDVFVHFRSIRGQGQRYLVEGQRVSFSVYQGKKGLQAEDISINQ